MTLQPPPPKQSLLFTTQGQILYKNTVWKSMSLLWNELQPILHEAKMDSCFMHA